MNLRASFFLIRGFMTDSPKTAVDPVQRTHRNAASASTASLTPYPQFVARKSIAKSGDAFHFSAFTLPVNVAFWCSTV